MTSGRQLQFLNSTQDIGKKLCIMLGKHNSEILKKKREKNILLDWLSMVKRPILKSDCKGFRLK